MTEGILAEGILSEKVFFRRRYFVLEGIMSGNLIRVGSKAPLWWVEVLGTQKRRTEVGKDTQGTDLGHTL